MKTETKGWVVVNENHPSGANPYVVTSTFSETRKEAIKNFVTGSGESWKYWYRKYNFKCVKAKSTVETL